MPLTPGMRLGSFEIAALIGVGGMGEVYRATDTNCPPRGPLVRSDRASNRGHGCFPRDERCRLGQPG